MKIVSLGKIQTCLNNSNSPNFIIKYRIKDVNRSNTLDFIRSLKSIENIVYKEYVDTFEISNKESTIFIIDYEDYSVQREIIYSEDYKDYGFEFVVYAQTDIPKEKRVNSTIKSRTGWKFYLGNYVLNIAHVTFDSLGGGETISEYEIKFEKVYSNKISSCSIKDGWRVFLSYLRIYNHTEILYSFDERRSVINKINSLLNQEKIYINYKDLLVSPRYLFPEDLLPGGLISVTKGLIPAGFSSETYTYDGDNQDFSTSYVVSTAPANGILSLLFFDTTGVWLFDRNHISKLSDNSSINTAIAEGFQIQPEERSYVSNLTPTTKFYFLATDLLFDINIPSVWRQPYHTRMKNLQSISNSLSQSDLTNILSFRTNSATEFATYQDFFYTMITQLDAMKTGIFFKSPILLFIPIYYTAIYHKPNEFISLVKRPQKVKWTTPENIVFDFMLNWSANSKGKIPHLWTTDKLLEFPFDSESLKKIESLPKDVILETKIIDNKIHVTRIRNDKFFPNSSQHFHLLLNLQKNPITESDLKGENTFFYSKNWIRSVVDSSDWYASGKDIPVEILDFLQKSKVKVIGLDEKIHLKELRTLNIDYVSSDEKVFIQNFALIKGDKEKISYMPKILRVLDFEKLPTPWYRDLYRFGTTPDGSCMVHSILTAISGSYQRQIKGKDPCFQKLALDFRKSIPYLLEQPLSSLRNTPLKMYSTVGNLTDSDIFPNILTWEFLEKIFPEYFYASQQILDMGLYQVVNDNDLFVSVDTSLPRVQYTILDTSSFIGESELPLIEVLLGIRVMFLSVDNNVVLPAPFKRNKEIDPVPHVILFNLTGVHWEVVGQKINEDNGITAIKTVFTHEDPIIKMIYAYNKDSLPLRNLSLDLLVEPPYNLTLDEIKFVLP